ncbi:MAG: hypothetical protein JWP91_2861 [Fibrobacteres bacterium]|nr:hypothetical protein [Fibrobacterota bacterium]
MTPAKPSIAATQDRTWIGILSLFLLLGAAAWLLKKTDQTKSADWDQSRLTYLPSGKLLKPMAMDLDEAVGDIFWVQAMIYFADAYLTGKSYQWLGHMLDIVTTLNTHLYAAYEFGGVVLTKEKRELPKTLKLLNRGMEAFPNDWRLRLYAATAQLAFDSNFTAAAEYLKPITLDKDVPDHIRTLCATLLNKGGGQRVALAFLVDRYLHSDNTINREIFVKKIIKLYPGPSDKETARKDAVVRILQEVSLEPRIELMALGIIHEYLSDTLTPQSKTLMELLYK